MPRKMLSVAKVAERIGAAERSVRLWAKQGKFTGAKLISPEVGAVYWLIPEKALKGFVKRQPGRPKKTPDSTK